MDKGVVLRRGPTKQVCAIAWNRRENRFKLGQWFKGRVYERRTDLSPDGKYLLYSATAGRERDGLRSWTAISKAPYLTAIGLWDNTGSWGGGLFSREDRFWLNGVGRCIRSPAGLKQQTDCPVAGPSAGDGVYYRRLSRNGWTSVRDPRRHETIFEKPLKGGWRLRKLDLKGSEFHELVKPSGLSQRRQQWEWAEFDGADLLWAEAGSLYSCRFDARGPGESKRLKDFNEMTFEPSKAPYGN